MTEQGMRELDRWIAEHAFGWTHFTTTGLGALVSLNPETGLPCDVPKYTAGDFAAVKREIERRGWSWESQYISGARMDIRYRFTVFTENWESDGCVNASSEELAGCLAFKAAVEAADATR